MKKLAIIIWIICFLFISVGYTFDEIISVDDLIKECPTLELLGDWIYKNIEYTSDKKVWKRDYWQSPQQTLKLRTGDCEDFAILFWIGTNKLGVKTTVAGAKYRTPKGKTTSHAFCLIEYDDNNDTCIGYFDTTGLDVFEQRIHVSIMMERFKVYKWKEIWIFKKKDNDFYSYHKGWKCIKKIKNKNRKQSKRLKL